MRAYEKEKAWRAYDGSPKQIVSFILPLTIIILIGLIVYNSKTASTITIVGLSVGLFLAVAASIYIMATAPEGPKYSGTGFMDLNPYWKDD